MSKPRIHGYHDNPSVQELSVKLFYNIPEFPALRRLPVAGIGINPQRPKKTLSRAPNRRTHPLKMTTGIGSLVPMPAGLSGGRGVVLSLTRLHLRNSRPFGNHAIAKSQKTFLHSRKTGPENDRGHRIPCSDARGPLRGEGRCAIPYTPQTTTSCPIRHSVIT